MKLYNAIIFVLANLSLTQCLAEELPLSVEKSATEVIVTAGRQTLVRYVFQDDQIPRPYFKDLKTPEGTQVSRRHPPLPGVDAEDHALFHPGLWLAFGDLSGMDTWRLKAKVVHERFSGEPLAAGTRVKFAVVNRYISTSGASICREESRHEIVSLPGGWLLLWDSDFSAESGDLVFGDQEEMGLGVRMATPLTVKNGGQIRNSQGEKNEKGCWGQTADWCDYSGLIETERCGVLLMGHPSNFKKCSFHARDYGFVAANPFAEKAFGRSTTAARTVVQHGDSLRLRFGILIYSRDSRQFVDAASEYANYLTLTR